MTDKEIPVYDISRGCYIPGVCSFSLPAVYSACRVGRIRKRTSGVHLKLPVLVYDYLDSDDLIDHFPDGSMRYRLFSVTIDEDALIDGQVVDTLISDDEGNQVILRTREY